MIPALLAVAFVVIVLLSLAFERLFLWGLARVESVLLERSGT